VGSRGSEHSAGGGDEVREELEKAIIFSLASEAGVAEMQKCPWE
jgi:hypothetical protein